MPAPSQPPDPQAERQSRRMARPGGAFLVLSSAVAVVGVILMIVGSGAVWDIGIVLLLLAGAPAVIGVAMLAAAAVTKRSAQRRPFA